MAILKFESVIKCQTKINSSTIGPLKRLLCHSGRSTERSKSLEPESSERFRTENFRASISQIRLAVVQR